MAAGQLWLFDPPKPLVDRFGEEFFAALPTGPGVYLMCGAQEGVLYVGKARNLRKRLSSYRVANPERLPRRTIRLLHQVRRIEWDECATEQTASEREEMLICVLAPKFNAAGKVREIKWRAGNPPAPWELAAFSKTWRGKSKSQLVAAATQLILNSARVTS
jgi:predicted GIY-YIG superfamily endonuclease